jgi:hypothetical protein
MLFLVEQDGAVHSDRAFIKRATPRLRRIERPFGPPFRRGR